MADVRQGGGAEQGVADGVGKGVGVGMALEADGAVSEMDAAEDHGATGDGAVDVVAVADAKVHERSRAWLGGAKPARIGPMGPRGRISVL